MADVSDVTSIFPVNRSVNFVSRTAKPVERSRNHIRAG
jgi:hypothetical protein